MMKRIGYTLYAMSLSVVVLAIAALFLLVENTMVTLIWDVWATRIPVRWAFSLPVAAAGTALAVAQLADAMDGYGTEFTVTFPAEEYFAALTFNAAGEAATGVLIDARGFRQTLRLDRIFSAP